MALSLEQLRSAFKKPEPNENNGERRSNNYLPFWNIKDGEQVVIRFLPDKNTENPFGFVVEKLMHSLVVNGENKSVPCLKMYNEDCPVCKVSSEYYKKEDKENGKKYWRKKQHIAQALVIEDPLPPDEVTGETHQGKVRFLALGYQLFQVIQAAFESGDLDEIPYNMDGGYDFVIKKTKQGEYSGYAVGSRFKGRPRDLTDNEREIAEQGMIDLSTLLPANPGEEKIAAMLNSDLIGETYSTTASETYSKSSNSSNSSEVQKVTVSAPTKVEAPANNVPSDEDQHADEILALIKSRRTKKVN